MEIRISSIYMRIPENTYLELVADSPGITLFAVDPSHELNKSV